MPCWDSLPINSVMIQNQNNKSLFPTVDLLYNPSVFSLWQGSAFCGWMTSSVIADVLHFVNIYTWWWLELLKMSFVKLYTTLSLCFWCKVHTSETTFFITSLYIISRIIWYIKNEFYERQQTLASCKRSCKRSWCCLTLCHGWFPLPLVQIFQSPISFNSYSICV